MENDRVSRGESYVKNFRPFRLGIIHLDKGRGSLILKASEVPGETVMDFRMLTLSKERHMIR